MKLSSCSLLFAAAALCSAQSIQLNPNPAISGTAPVRTPGPLSSMDLEQSRPMIMPLDPEGSQAGCPVVLTNVSLETKARYMPVDTPGAKSDSPSLDLEFQNKSGKEILSVAFEARLKLKRSIYDLDSTNYDVFLTLPGTAITDQMREQTRVVPLRVPAFAVGTIVLHQVTYSDGTVWAAADHNVCEKGPEDSQRVIAK